MLRPSFHVLTLALLFASIGAHAQTILFYTGQPMGPSPGSLVTGTLTLAQPLAPNGTQTVTPTAAWFTGNLVIPAGLPDPYGYDPPRWIFSFTTENGVITHWNVYVEGAEGSTNSFVSLTDAGDSYELQAYAGDCQVEPAKCTDTVVSNTLPGAWSVPQAQVAPTMAALQTQVSTLTTQNANLTVERNSYLHGYLAENAIIAEQNAALVELKLSVYYLNAEVTKCRANQGKC